MKKVLLTATVQSHIAQFHKPLINLLQEKGYEVHIAARDNLTEKNNLKLEEPDRVFNIPFDRSPLSIKNILAYRALKKILSENKYNIIHCNTPMGGVITRLAARKYRKKGTKVFYTAHGFHFYKGSPKSNWLLYYPIEKILSKYTDKLITISEEDYKTAQQKNFRTNIEHVHGVGADTKKYFAPSSELIHDLRLKIGYSDSDFICICTGELNKNKNQIMILNAVPTILKEIPNFKLILAGNGPEEMFLKEQINKMGINNSVNMIGYVSNLENYVMMSDIALSASLREGLGLNLVEAMLCAKPVVGSNNRGHRELIEHMENGFLINPISSEKLAKAVIDLYLNQSLKSYMGLKGIMHSHKYTKDYVTNELSKVYEFPCEN